MFRGEKRCGGFHPDYAVVWQSETETDRVCAQICFGCDEIAIISGETAYRYDIQHTANPKILFENFRKERPAYQSGEVE